MTCVLIEIIRHLEDPRILCAPRKGRRVIELEVPIQIRQTPLFSPPVKNNKNMPLLDDEFEMDIDILNLGLDCSKEIEKTTETEPPKEQKLMVKIPIKIYEDYLNSAIDNKEKQIKQLEQSNQVPVTKVTHVKMPPQQARYLFGMCPRKPGNAHKIKHNKSRRKVRKDKRRAKSEN